MKIVQFTPALFEEKLRSLIAMAPLGTTRGEVIRQLLIAVARHPQSVKPEQEALVAWLRKEEKKYG